MKIKEAISQGIKNKDGELIRNAVETLRLKCGLNYEEVFGAFSEVAESEGIEYGASSHEGLMLLADEDR